MTNKLNVSTPSDLEILITREFNAPRDLVWNAFSNPELIKQWLFGPPGWTMTTCEDDLRVGGTFRIVMVDDESSNVHTGTYREIDRPRRLVFTWSSPVTQFRDTVVTVTFQPAPNGATVVEIHQVGLPDEDARASHEAGWSDALRKLSDAEMSAEP